MATAAGAIPLTGSAMYKNKKPWLGFIGLLLIIPGCALVNSKAWFLSISLIVVGIGLLVWAMFTGNLTLFG